MASAGWCRRVPSHSASTPSHGHTRAAMSAGITKSRLPASTAMPASKPRLLPSDHCGVVCRASASRKAALSGSQVLASRLTPITHAATRPCQPLLSMASPCTACSVVAKPASATECSTALAHCSAGSGLRDCTQAQAKASSEVATQAHCGTSSSQAESASAPSPIHNWPITPAASQSCCWSSPARRPRANITPALAASSNTPSTEPVKSGVPGVKSKPSALTSRTVAAASTTSAKARA